MEQLLSSNIAGHHDIPHSDEKWHPTCIKKPTGQIWAHDPLNKMQDRIYIILQLYLPHAKYTWPFPKVISPKVPFCHGVSSKPRLSGYLCGRFLIKPECDFSCSWTKKISYFFLFFEYTIAEEGQSNCIEHSHLERGRTEDTWQILIWLTILKSYQAVLVRTFYPGKWKGDGNVTWWDSNFAPWQGNLKAITFLHGVCLFPTCHNCCGH